MAKIFDERKKGLEEQYFRRKEQQALEKTAAPSAEESERNEALFTRCPPDFEGKPGLAGALLPRHTPMIKVKSNEDSLWNNRVFSHGIGSGRF